MRDNTSAPEAPAPWWRLPLAAFGFALAVRLAYLFTADGPAFADPLIDADFHDYVGNRISTGEGFPPGPFWQPPLYPLLLGALYTVAGNGLFGPRLLQALLGAIAAALVFDLARRATSRRGPAIAGAVLFALHGPLVFYTGELLAVSLGSFLAVAAVWLALRPPSTRAAAAAGGAVGLGALAVAPLLLLVAPVGWACARGGRKKLAACLGACALVVLPVTAANQARSGEWVLISANGGLNLWLGNNPAAEETVAIRPGAEWEALMQRPIDAGARGPGEADAWFAQKALAYCAREPLSCGRGLLRKTRLLFASRELPRNEDIYVVEKQSPVLRVLLARVGGAALPYALLFPLAFAGAAGVLRTRRLEELAPLAAAAALAVVPVIFFVTGRYRAPLAPMLCVLAAVGIVELTARRRAAIAAACVGLLLAVLPVEVASDRTDFEAELHYASGGRRARLGDDDGAVAAWRRAVTLRPDYLEARYNLGLAEERLGRPREAAATYAALLERHPDHLESLVRRAGALLEAGELAGAEQGFAAVLRRVPDEAEALMGLALVALRRGDEERARELAAVLLAVGAPDEAAEVDRLLRRAAGARAR